jgi:peroxin-12
MLLIDRHFLVTYGTLKLSQPVLTVGGSFTENFYGLKRERTLSSPPLPRTAARVPVQVSQRTKLRTTEIYKSLFMLVRPLIGKFKETGWSVVSQIQT